MRLLSLFIATPLMLVAVVFALVNNHAVELRLFIEGITVSIPLYLLVLLPFLVGFSVGAFLSWWRQRSYRVQVKALEKKITHLEKIKIQQAQEEASSNIKLIEQA